MDRTAMRLRPTRKINLGRTLFLLPNIITIASIFCGFDSIRLASSATTNEDFYRSALLIIFAMFFDTLDGRVARMTKTQSAFGLQIDSLADAISFGIAPSILVYEWMLYRLGDVGLVISFVFAACGVIRLARFNVLSTSPNGNPTKPSKYVIGLPIPGAAGILVSIVVANHAASNIIGAEHVWIILGITIFLSFLMVSTIRFRSFKDLRLNVPTVALVAIVIISSISIATQTKPAFALVWVLSFYILLGITETLWQFSKRLHNRVRNKNTEMIANPPAQI